MGSTAHRKTNHRGGGRTGNGVGAHATRSETDNNDTGLFASGKRVEEFVRQPTERTRFFTPNPDAGGSTAEKPDVIEDSTASIDDTEAKTFTTESVTHRTITYVFDPPLVLPIMRDGEIFTSMDEELGIFIYAWKLSSLRVELARQVAYLYTMWVLSELDGASEDSLALRDALAARILVRGLPE